MVKIHYFGTEEVQVTCDVDISFVSIHGVQTTRRKTMTKRLLLDEKFDGRKDSEMFSLLREEFDQRTRDWDLSNYPIIHAILGIELVNYSFKVDDLMQFDT